MRRKNEATQFDMINSLSWYFYKKNNGTIEFDEIYAEACYGYFKARSYFKSDKGAKFTTYAYRAIYNTLQIYCVKEQQYLGNTTEMTDVNLPTLENNLNDFLESLYNSCTGLTKVLIKLALRGVGGKEYRQNCLQASLRKKLIEFGYDSGEISLAFDEVKELLQKV